MELQSGKKIRQSVQCEKKKIPKGLSRLARYTNLNGSGGEVK